MEGQLSVKMRPQSLGRFGKYLYRWYTSGNAITSFGEGLPKKRGKKSKELKMSAEIANFLRIEAKAPEKKGTENDEKWQ
jgi:hypothetical protein